MNEVRKKFVEFIYRNDLVDEGKEEFLRMVSLDGEDRKRLEELIDFYLENRKSIMDEVSSVLKGWRLDRLLNLDKAAILAGACEILLGENPDEVIPSYGDFAKVFSTEKSPSFVMGVLKSFKEVVKR